MMLHPGILALLLGSAISFFLVFYASILGLIIMTHWDFTSSSEGQLLLERKTYLISTIVGMVLGFTLFSGLLFLYTIDDIHSLFVGAMCGTGTLNANPIGWLVLLSKGIIFFCASLWVIFNHLDQHCEDAPLVRYKYGALLILALLLGADLVLQSYFFSGLHPEKITSCCGSLFGSGSATVAGELAAFPPGRTMWIFYGAACCYLLSILLCLISHSWLLRILLLIESLLLLPISLTSVISFISLYIYQMPSHHCPFDMIQKNYYFIGYPLYMGLFGGILFGLVPGLCLLLRNTASLNREIEKREKRWLIQAFLFFSIFLTISTWPILFGKFQLFAY
ncbi:MAG: hypothetical protein KKD01_00570 [Proteobacteria bacterium]|nr:hypothetical protein [Pseudomonadota bacterium]MBU1232710.1 hypothetical protein [Pseudomonadota bacterium]MBU1418529.1 hypothetical protein [Pseudomonadota bacterium]MBU1453191.1 hypothetical protein [Pseudomonadota bacterium]